jgi:hypothetical protein
MITNPQNIKFSAYETVIFEITMTTFGSIAGNTYSLNIRDKETNALLYTNTSASIINVGSPTTFGIVDVGPMSSTDTGTLGPGDYLYDIWRTNTGQEKRLTYGTLTVLTEEWK